MTLKNKKLIIIVCSVFCGGLLSGLVFQLFIFPLILANSYFSQFQFIKNFKEGKIIINTKEEIIIQENAALEKAIEKVEKSVVGIKTNTADGAVLNGSGLVVTSDGLIVTLAELVPAGSSVNVFLNDQTMKPQILKRDSKNNLVLLKIEKTGLTTCGFSDFEKLKLGRRIFLIGALSPLFKENIVNEGVIKTFNENAIKTNIFETNSLKGSPLFDISGNLVGLNDIDSAGKVIAIPISKIKDFIGF